MDKLIWRKAAIATAPLWPVAPRLIFLNQPLFVRHASTVPSIMQTSFWKNLVPKPFRRSERSVGRRGTLKGFMSKEWNPATFYIIIFLFIGSMAIQMIVLKKDFETFMRRSEVRIGTLREVVEKLQRGEEVDVEKALGTGDAEKEKEWEEVLREIERDDILKNTKKSEKTKQPTTDLIKTESSSSPGVTEIREHPKTKAGGYSNFF
ncbi:uncharacterized protein F4812DRAFT_51715 [Daldinia caldariorum]|uniref:uncharacterized protein n=1 Tax=Daldinia caldariorum TaxID=326644 RepID=UPI002008B9FD|nr:uncharacterized protein F4812DRAFT_51715 [Daldinia caldariorum]KAI1467169.1 hypothetical protein F4812DRAFT_51715 [Daldinia caldariorum]